jgi:hypothetical protein
MATNLLLAGTVETPSTAPAWASPPHAPGGQLLLDPGSLEARLEAVQWLIALYLVALGMEQRQSRHGWECHVLDKLS